MVLGSRKQTRDNANISPLSYHLSECLPSCLFPLLNKLRRVQKKTIANGNKNFKPRGEKNKADFEALKKQAHPDPDRIRTETTTIDSNIVSSPQKRIKITVEVSHISDSASLLDIHPKTTSDTLDEKWKTHREENQKTE